MDSKHGSHIIKRRGHSEPFDEKKIYASAYAACLNAEMKEQQCEGIADKVMKQVTKNIKNKHNAISSSELADLTYKELQKHNKDAAFLYRTHLDLS